MNALQRLLTNALSDLSMLCGDTPMPEGTTVADVAGTCAANLQALGSRIERLRFTNEEQAFIPSPATCMRVINNRLNDLDRENLVDAIADQAPFLGMNRGDLKDLAIDNIDKCAAMWVRGDAEAWIAKVITGSVTT